MSIIKNKKLSRAVTKFTSAMRTRLAVKEKIGYKGWDGDMPRDLDLLHDIQHDATILEKQWGTAEKEKLLVDIANRTMMLWNRMRASA